MNRATVQVITRIKIMSLLIIIVCIYMSSPALNVKRIFCILLVFLIIFYHKW